MFTKIIENKDLNNLVKFLNTSPSEYWKTHYLLDEVSVKKSKNLGMMTIQNIIINTVAPLLVAYGKYKDEQVYIDKAVELLQQLTAEQNKITRTWNDLGMKVKTSFDSQSLIELYNNFCQRRQCLNCSIGISILKPKP